MGAIDVDRGVIFRQIVKFDAKNPNRFEPDHQYGGLSVYMYVDTPGVYFDVHGKEVAPALAKKAGYDTTKLGKLRAKALALEEYNERLKAELAIELEGDEEVLAEAGDWKIVALPNDRAKVVDKETGEAVTAVPMSRKDAKQLLSDLVSVNEETAIQAKGAK